MGDADEKAGTAAVPAWQRPSAEKTPDSTSEKQPTIEQAKVFLQDDSVRNASREKKIEFLNSKGFDEADIVPLLDEDTARDTSQASKDTSRDQDTPALASTVSSSSEKEDDHAPIITYPEFLTKSAKPPPLVTATGLLSTLYAVAGLSTLAYGTAKYVVSPMVDSLTDARLDLHHTASQNLTTLIEKLEGTVSEIPPTTRYTDAPVHADASDSASSYDDPTELFHRDVGVQTSLPPSPVDTSPSALPASGASSSATAAHTQRLSRLAGAVRSLAEDTSGQTEELAAARAQLGAFADEVSQVRLQAQSSGLNLSYMSGGGRGSSEPDDEIRRAKENIRRVKGVLLSARNFPVSTR
ncbi:Peroxin 14/17 [Pleurostoma richardsiae]|uniref:Peroxisomal membrane protein PEX14 n=1 Tax=Pleurostoma richardsiae TaxID=41990 RepID=A0AA38RLJ9_9PEZI|nr:Peroxin 14/17 [Pleurostoma richardsiae]